MSTTFNVPLTTLAAGQDITSPAEAIGSFTSFLLVVNRNVGATPLDSLPATAAIEPHSEVSTDGGNTWIPDASTTFPGGPLHDKHGTQVETSPFGSSITTSVAGVAVTHFRGRFHIVQGCTISGSLTLSP